MGSKELSNLNCVAHSILFNICLSQRDLKELGVWREEDNSMALSPAAWSRAFLQYQCRRSRAQFELVTDHLDLRFLETVVLMREMDLDELDRTTALWLENPVPAALPGVLWALCSDPRPRAQALGQRLCHEAALFAYQALMVGDSEYKTIP